MFLTSHSTAALSHIHTHTHVDAAVFQPCVARMKRCKLEACCPSMASNIKALKGLKLDRGISCSAFRGSLPTTPFCSVSLSLGNSQRLVGRINEESSSHVDPELEQTPGKRTRSQEHVENQGKTYLYRTFCSFK